MKVSYQWLERYFDVPLPPPDKVADALTFHIFEIESVDVLEDDTVFDVKITANRGYDSYSHRGIAKELSVIFNLPLKNDPLRSTFDISKSSQELAVSITEPKRSKRYTAAVIKNVEVKKSPEWLQKALEAIGQRPINNIVDATNYVMFSVGQPLHAFDADKLERKDSKWHIDVRLAQEGEKIMTLDNKEYALTSNDLLIVDKNTNAPLGIAGIKGGKQAEVDKNTQNIIIESANFDRVSVRKSSQRLKLRTDASARFENEPSPELTAIGIREVVALIQEIAHGTLEGYVDVYPEKQGERSITFSVSQLNGLLGTRVSISEVEDILNRFTFAYVKGGEDFTVTPPFERLDLQIKEDLIEEIGRIYGLDKIQSVVPEKNKPAVVNKRYYYADKIRRFLVAEGFSEVFTSSFRNEGEVELANALADDKGYLRKNLRDNLVEALGLNEYNAPLLGLDVVKLFEIGTVFNNDGEHYVLGIATRMKKRAEADAAVQGVLEKLFSNLGTSNGVDVVEGVAEIDLDMLISKLPDVSEYDAAPTVKESRYQSISVYPFVLRDIAVWVPAGVEEKELTEIIKREAGEWLVRLDLFDRFEKDGKISYAFHLVFQSYEKTLSDTEVGEKMEKITQALSAKEGWQVR